MVRGIIPFILTFFGGGRSNGFENTYGGRRRRNNDDERGGRQNARQLGRHQAGSRPMNNEKQNEQARAVVARLKLDEEQAQELHHAIHKEGVTGGYRDILQFARDYFNIY